MEAEVPESTPDRPQSCDDLDKKRKDYLRVNTSKLEKLMEKKHHKFDETSPSESAATPRSSASSLSASTLVLGSSPKSATDVESDVPKVPQVEGSGTSEGDPANPPSTDIGLPTVKPAAAKPKVLQCLNQTPQH